MILPMKWQFSIVRPGTPSADPSAYSAIAPAPQSVESAVVPQ